MRVFAKNRLRGAVAALVWLSVLPDAGAQMLSFERYTIRDGLASNWVTTIFQDSRGYLWVGGDGGLVVYDGFTFKKYGTDDGLPVGHVWKITESKKTPGIIYIGTHGGGLTRFENGQFRSTKLGPDRRDNIVTKIVEDDRGVVWCGTVWGLYRVEDDSVEFISVPDDSGTVPAIVTSQNGDVLFTSNIYPRLYTYKQAEKKVISQDFSIAGQGIASLYEDENGQLWFGSSTGELHRSDGQAILATKKLGGTWIRQIQSDGDGRLWLATSTGLLSVKTAGFPETGVVRYTAANGLPNTDIETCMLDRENNLWVGYARDGLVKWSERNIRSFPLTFYRSSAYGNNAIYDARGRMFVVSDSNFSEIWQAKNGWQLRHHRLDTAKYSIAERSVDIAPDGTLWLSHLNGWYTGYTIEPNGDRASMLKLIAALEPGKDVEVGAPIGMKIDEKNQLWASLWRKGLLQVDLNTGTQVAFWPVDELIKGGTVQDVYFDAHQRQWVGTYRDGVYMLSEKEGALAVKRHYTTDDGLASNSIRSVMGRKNGELWLGTRFDGISVYKYGQFRTISTRDGLLNNAVWALAEDASGRVWVGTSVGIQAIEYDDSLRFYSHNRLRGRFINALGISPDQKSLWSASPEELMIFDFEKSEIASPPPPVYITDFRVNGEARQLQGDLQLQYDENNCAIEFSGISFKSGRPVMYRYRLDGLEINWQEPTVQRLVTYGSLPPGEYAFEVTAINADGIESTSPARLRFVILQPIWQRGWFVALALLLFGAILYSWHRLRLRRLLQIEKIRSHIATDLHDDIGAGLTHINLLSEVAVRKVGLKQAHNTGAASLHHEDVQQLSESMRRVGVIARDLSAAMSDVVWSINPKHDSVEALQHRLTAFAHEVCSAKNIDLQIRIADSITSMRLNPELRSNLLMIAKEALHNAVKYSDAKRIQIEMRYAENHLIVGVEDYGNGFEAGGNAKGNGLSNMRMRAEKLGGVCTIRSEPGKGTRVQARVPYKP